MPKTHLKKIDVIIIGAQKAATTSMKHYLGEHPDIKTHAQKEFGYFTSDEEFELGFETSFKNSFSTNLRNKKQLLLAKNAGLYTDKKFIQRLYDHNPNCKLVFILRNPVERAYSSYLMEKSRGAIDFPFEIIKNKNNSSSIENFEEWYNIFINFGKYSEHLTNIYKYFPKENVFIFSYNNVKDNTKEVCRNIFNLLQLNEDFIPKVDIRYNVTRMTISKKYPKLISKLSTYNFIKNSLKKILSKERFARFTEFVLRVNLKNHTYPEMTEEMTIYLKELYKPYNKNLSTLIDFDISSWD